MKSSRFGSFAGCALVVAGALAGTSPAEARHYRDGGYYGGHHGGHYGRRGGWSPGAAAAVGIIGGLALGSVLARPAYGAPYGGYGPAPVYAPPPVYTYGPPCRIVHRQVWDPWRGPMTERIRICPY